MALRDRLNQKELRVASITFRTLRSYAGLSMQKVADAVGIHRTTLHSLENNAKASPRTIELLSDYFDILPEDALNPQLSFYVIRGNQDTPPDDSWLKWTVDQRKEADGTTSGYHFYPNVYAMSQWHFLKPKLQARIIDLGPGASTTKHLDHGGEELLYMLEGEITVDLKGVDDRREEVPMRTGDMIHFRGAIPHRGVNHGEVPARFLIVHHPPLLDE